MADIYGPVEDFVGDFRHKLLALKGKEGGLERIQALTKWVPQPRIIHVLPIMKVFKCIKKNNNRRGC
jgi:hypothetical protein